jgi:hypothetical protein
VCVMSTRIRVRGEEVKRSRSTTTTWVWTGMCVGRPKERERSERESAKGGGRGDARGSDDDHQGDGRRVSGRATPLTSSSGRMPSSSSMSLRECRTGPQMGQGAQPRGEERSVFQTVLYVERFHHASRIYLVVGSCPACSALMLHRSNINDVR